MSAWDRVCRSPGRPRGARVRRGRAVIVTVATLVLLAVPTGSFAAADAAGTTAAGFLGVGTGAGVLGRGGATLALTGDLDIVPWNPAALGWLGETQVTVAHAGLADDVAQEWFGIGGRFGRTAFRWALDGLYQSEGSFEGRDELNQATGSFDVSSMAFGAHLAHPVGPFVTVGAGGKYVGEKLGSVSGAGYTMDAGAQLRVAWFGAGVAVTNVGGRMDYSGRSYDMPMNVGVGAALDVPLTGLRLAVDANFPRAYYDDVRVGAEWRWHDLVALRAGYRKELDAPAELTESGPTFGVGAGLHGLWLDYGYVIPGSGDGQHRLAISLRPGRLGWLAGSTLRPGSLPESFDDPRAGANSPPAKAD
jgi:hypothetical protein